MTRRTYSREARSDDDDVKLFGRIHFLSFKGGILAYIPADPNTGDKYKLTRTHSTFILYICSRWT